MKKVMGAALCLALLGTLVSPAHAGRRGAPEEPAFDVPVMEHHYELQSDSYEATDTEGGYRHYVCRDCGDSYDYHTDPLVYTVNPKTGEPVTQAGAYNPLLPSWEHIPDAEPNVFWSKEDQEWRCYLYGSHDDTGIGYCGFNYVLYSAPVYDLSDWRCDGVYLDISEHATSGATVGLFAPDCAYDVNTDLYYLISNEFNAYSVLRTADSPCGPWKENEALWKISVKAAYDPSIYIEDGTIYIAGSCMKMIYNEYPEVQEAVAADDYKSGMSHIGVLYQLKEDLSDGDGIEAISWLPNDDRSYLPIYEGPSLSGYIDELGVYVYFYVSYDVGMDGAWYNNGLGWLWTDDLMGGTWHFGENKVDEVYPEVSYVISGNHGNIVSDTSGRYVRNQETGAMEFTDFPTYTHGNNHGGLAKVNGTWYFFGHRQTGGHSYSRQTVAGEVKLYLDGDTPVIEPFEYTSSGIAPAIYAYETIPADRTVYLLEEAGHPAPSVENGNLHSDCLEHTPYIVATREEGEHLTYITGLTNGSLAGYKYLDFGEEGASRVRILVSAAGEAEGTVTVYADDPEGTALGSIAVSGETLAGAETEEGSDGRTWSWLETSLSETLTGRHSIYFAFETQGEEALCDFDAFGFEK